LRIFPRESLGEQVRVRCPLQQCLQHRASRNTQHVAGHHSQLHPGILQHLVESIHLAHGGEHALHGFTNRDLRLKLARNRRLSRPGKRGESR